MTADHRRLLDFVLISLFLGLNLNTVRCWNVRQILDELENEVSVTSSTEQVDNGDSSRETNVDENDDVSRDQQVTTPGVIAVEQQPGNTDPCAGFGSPPFVIRSANGWIASPNYPENYANSQRCHWLITSPSTYGVVSISFSNVSTESCCDYVNVYDGNNTNAPLLGVVKGEAAITFTSTQPEMLVTFSTDSSVTSRGFNATYSRPADNVGTPTTYQITITTGSREQNVTDFAVNIILHGLSGATHELSLYNEDNTRFSPWVPDTFIFTDVTSVGIIRCVDFKVFGSDQDPMLFITTVRIEDGDGNVSLFDLYRSYLFDSERWPTTHGCGTKYTVLTITGSHPAASSSANVFVTLIGEKGNSPEFILRGRYEAYFSRGSYDSYSFNSLPDIGEIECVNLRRNDKGYNPSWFAVSVNVNRQTENAINIKVDSWVPSISTFSTGIVACVNGSTRCISDIDSTCPVPTFWVEMTTFSREELIKKFVNVDMFDFCPAIQEYTQCVRSILPLHDNCGEESTKLTKQDRLLIEVSSMLIEHVCGSYIADVSCYKECLLQVDDDGELILPRAVKHHCKEFLNEDTATDPLPLCQSNEFVQCAKDVVTRQCNSGVADLAIKIYAEVSEKLCDPRTRPACPYQFTKSGSGCHKVFTERKDWFSATQKCSELGRDGHLVFFDNDNEQLHVSDLLQNNAGSSCLEQGGGSNVISGWTGGRRQSWPPVFRWHYNQTTPAGMVCPPDWYKGSRDDYNEYCVKVQTLDKTANKFTHADCWNSYCFVCEIDV